MSRESQLSVDRTTGLMVVVMTVTVMVVTGVAGSSCQWSSFKASKLRVFGGGWEKKKKSAPRFSQTGENPTREKSVDTLTDAVRHGCGQMSRNELCLGSRCCSRVLKPGRKGSDGKEWLVGFLPIQLGSRHQRATCADRVPWAELEIGTGNQLTPNRQGSGNPNRRKKALDKLRHQFLAWSIGFPWQTEGVEGEQNSGGGC